ncbi:myosin-binding protein H-like isoform X1 [Pteropus alecto]|uniref:Myosin-binding protein H-like n=1 Tax=Pteropus alecto TaxID=9402 RepID=L5K3E1_PTEAL|nr:myosin-binding protein H-like isoform X1 [Pteropus alecto]ELK05862.1 Myosin-binding protein H-like protein [Pteropus alecto]
MEAATAAEVASGPTLKVKEVSPADAEELQTSPRQGAGSPIPQLLLSPIEENPKIWLPRALRQTYIRKVGDIVNLLIPFQGKPKPRATWTHNGCALDASRVSVRNGERDSILFIREAQRADSGRYQLSVQLGGLEATATIDILVIERPGPPQSIKLTDVSGSNATLEWTPPRDTGNAALLGYTVQKADTKSGLWFTVLEHYRRTSCTVSNLIAGNSYAFRVFAENQCGLSETAPITADLAHIQKAATVYKTKGFAQRDFSEAPKFTQPLADCTTVTGYDTQLFCCVRASPKPKIIWLKNKMDIQGDPKYRALTNLGICSLEIRKPGPFDGGIYTCKAVNSLGEASVDCRVDVKGKGRIHALRCVISSLQRWKSQGRDTSLDGEGFGLIPISGPLITVINRMYLRSHFYFPLSHFFLSILILEYRKNCYLYFAKEEPEAQGGR